MAGLEISPCERQTVCDEYKWVLADGYGEGRGSAALARLTL